MQDATTPLTVRLIRAASVLLVVGTIAVCFTIWREIRHRIDTASEQERLASVQVAELEKELGPLAGFKRQHAHVELLLARVRNLRRDREFTPVKLLDALPAALPAGAAVTSLEWNADGAASATLTVDVVGDSGSTERLRDTLTAARLCETPTISAATPVGARSSSRLSCTVRVSP